MHTLKWVITVFYFLFVINGAFSQLPQGAIAGSDIIKFKSAINNQDYVLYIKLPPSYSDTDKKKYPVMYVLDGQWDFTSVMEIRGGLLYDNLISEIIFVGIAFPQNPFANRNRDFTPTFTSFDSASGGAPKFLEVIRSEIMKKIDSVYRTDKTNNGILGHSSGGLFVLYALFQQPSPFNRFIATSPSLWYDNELISKLEKTFSEKNRMLNAKLFISNGGYEEEYDPPMFKKFNDQLKASKYKGLEIESLVIDKMGHQSAGSYGIGRGLHFIFSKPDIVLDTLLLNQYVGHYEQGLIFTRTGSSLYVDMGGKKIRINAATNASFYVTGVNGTFEFIKNDKNKVTGFSAQMAEGTFFAKKLD